MANATKSPHQALVNELRKLEFYTKVDHQQKYDLNSNAVQYIETGIEDYDQSQMHTRWEWLLKALEFDETGCISGKVGVYNRGKVHLLEADSENTVFQNTGYTTMCHKEPSNMRVKLTTHIELDDRGICKHCLNRKQRLTAAKIAIDRTGCLE